MKTKFDCNTIKKYKTTSELGFDILIPLKVAFQKRNLTHYGLNFLTFELDP